MDKLIELRQALGKAEDDLKALADSPSQVKLRAAVAALPALTADAKAFDAKEAEVKDLKDGCSRAERAKQAEIDDLKEQIRGLERTRATAAASARPFAGAGDGQSQAITIPPNFALDGAPDSRRNWQGDAYLRAIRKAINFTPDPVRHFVSFGEQLQAIARYYLNGRDRPDERLVRAPTGAGEVDPSGGGFLVQTDFATAVFLRAYEMGRVLASAQKLTISTSANSIKIPGVDETSRANGSRWGGVSTSWVGEGTSGTGSKPKFRQIELDLKKLLSVWYVTDELMADASVLNSIANQAFAEEIVFAVEDAMFRGTGAGQPMGFLNAACKVSVAKETGQATKTIEYNNILKMWSRMWGRSRPNATWFINQDVEPQLYSLSQVIGTAGVPVYLPANGISGNPYGMLFGRPVIPVEYADTVGSEGDITLCDFSQYVLADKGGVQAASSMHVAFLTDEMAFRIVYRVDGEPIWHSALTPYKGSNTLSPFISLAAR